MWANPFDVHCSENPCLETLVTLRFRLQIQAQKDFNHSPLAKPVRLPRPLNQKPALTRLAKNPNPSVPARGLDRHKRGAVLPSCGMWEFGILKPPEPLGTRARPLCQDRESVSAWRGIQGTLVEVREIISPHLRFTMLRKGVET